MASTFLDRAEKVKDIKKPSRAVHVMASILVMILAKRRRVKVDGAKDGEVSNGGIPQLSRSGAEPLAPGKGLQCLDCPEQQNPQPTSQARSRPFGQTDNLEVSDSS